MNESQSGWVKLWRKSLDSDVFADPHLWRLFCWCLLRANRKPRQVPVNTGRGNTIVALVAGQFVTGRKAGSAELGWAGNTFSRRLGQLAGMGMIAVKPGTHFSIVSIVNWGTYQASDSESGQATGQATGRQRGRQQGRLRAQTRKEEKKKSKSLSAHADGRDQEREFIELWNRTSGIVKNRGEMFTDSRRRKFKTRLATKGWFEDVKPALAKFPLKCFQNDSDPWRPDVDWILKPDSVSHILEGKYDWSKGGNGEAKKQEPIKYRA